MSKPKPAAKYVARIHLQSGDWKGALANYRAVIGAAVRGALKYANAVDGAVNIALMDDGQMRVLNHQFRGKDKPTNVLSFPCDDDGELGDIALALETIAREAVEQSKPFHDHLVHLVVHGVLHLLGMDHEEKTEAEAMEAEEISILARKGIENPYIAR